MNRGEVEIHDRDTDIFYVLEGSASIVTGGNAIEPRPTTRERREPKASPAEMNVVWSRVM
jgi:hypothetical protein